MPPGGRKSAPEVASQAAFGTVTARPGELEEGTRRLLEEQMVMRDEASAARLEHLDQLQTAAAAGGHGDTS